MEKKKKGSIINIGCHYGLIGPNQRIYRKNGQQQFYKPAAYSVTKAGMIGFTKSIAKELGSRNIRCNAVAPGFIKTEMTEKLGEDIVKGWEDGIPLKRGGETEDVANACLFLGSDMSTYVTGQVLNVCGGMLI